MSVLVFAENNDGKFKKSTYELITYSYETSKKLNTDLLVLSIGPVDENNLKSLGNYGASKIVSVNDENVKVFKTEIYAGILKNIAEKYNSKLIITPNTFNGKSVAPRLSGMLNAGMITGVTSIAENSDNLTFEKPVFSGKGFGYFKINTDIAIVSLAINSHGVKENKVDSKIESLESNINSDQSVNYTIENVEKTSGKFSLTDAEIVVSGGRGMKGPENWKMIEELADLLGAATACSKPVSDMDWRPHSEHVGQTGITISPNLYIAIGISGAIQHLAGVSSSKVIVVINKDAEAPFFGNADYGIIGDAFEVVPKLIEAAKKFKN